MQVEGFRKHIPLLQVVCNKGMKERHWNQVYGIVGFHVRPETPTELSTVGPRRVSPFVLQDWRSYLVCVCVQHGVAHFGPSGVLLTLVVRSC